MTGTQLHHTIHIQTVTVYSVFIQHEAYHAISHIIGTLDLLLLAFMDFFFFASNATTCPHGLRGPPSWAWQECNWLLRLGRPWGAVTLLWRFINNSILYNPVIQPRRSQVWFLMMSLEFFIDFLLTALWPWGQLSL